MMQYNIRAINYYWRYTRILFGYELIFLKKKNNKNHAYLTIVVYEINYFTGNEHLAIVTRRVLTGTLRKRGVFPPHVLF